MRFSTAGFWLGFSAFLMDTGHVNVINVYTDSDVDQLVNEIFKQFFYWNP